MAASSGRISVSRKSISEMALYDSSGKLFDGCSGVLPSWANTSAPRARCNGSFERHQSAARSKTSQLPIRRKALTASQAGSSSYSPRSARAKSSSMLAFSKTLIRCAAAAGAQGLLAHGEFVDKRAFQSKATSRYIRNGDEALG